ncbi:MAG: DUF87 domain-containing protein [Anaerolineales bacterium]|nr:DUF87 domain-containing protein [Anaerolineales bacterium]
MLDKKKFYLGKLLEGGKVTDSPFLYDPEDLTTHAFVVGMTGSGKTGLCIDLLEEAALKKVPVFMIDPKGDITNTLLHFPELLPEDFKPWVDADAAKRNGKTTEQAAEETASLWENGLKKWGLGKTDIAELNDSAHFTVYSPGSSSGIPVNILSSFKSPDMDWDEDAELLREKISGITTAILGLAGFDDVDSVQSREHILISNIFENAWRNKQDLDLGNLILRIQTPPFERLGVMDINSVYPEKDRFGLAMGLNNILASPSFQTWITGPALDIESMLYGEDGKPCHNVFYIAHLSDRERMFFITLLYTAVETWMRQQSGSGGLRALVYFDEIYGYLPPVANPPSKQVMLRLMKQGRAFGVGQLLVTQNPADLDYKALTNAGTWFIGRLQTETDKNRLLDGLESATDNKYDRKTIDKLISGLDKRVFLAHNIHEDKPVIFQTRWAMNYLAGPLTRNQLDDLNKLAGNAAKKQKSTVTVNVDKPTKTASNKEASNTLTSKPVVPGGINEFFLPNNLSLSESIKKFGGDDAAVAEKAEIVYEPVLLAQAKAHFIQRKYNLENESVVTAIVDDLNKQGLVHWDKYLNNPVDVDQLDSSAVSGSSFGSPKGTLFDASKMKELENDFTDWIYFNVKAKVWQNETLGIFGGPELTEGDFRKQCSEAAKEKLEMEIEKINASYKTKLESIQQKLTREKRELQQDETELSQRRLEEMGTHLENVIGLLGKSKRRVSTSLTKRRMTQQAKADVDESIQAIDELEKDILELQNENKDKIDQLEEKWAKVVTDISHIENQAYKKDIFVTLFGLAWYPMYEIKQGTKKQLIPAFSPDKYL